MTYKKDLDFSLMDRIIRYENKLINWNADFGMENGNITGPLIVEIGCGNGHFLVGKALENPDCNYIGIDKKNERLVKCREKEVRTGLTNIKWVSGDAFYIIKDMFSDYSISMIFMIFPDPWPKRRHHKNRLFQQNFLDVLYMKLKDKGQFIFVTDFKEYFVQCMELINNDKRFNILELENQDNFSISIFGDKWMKDNREFHILNFRKT
jgi:tRNA (guanine-N7-)-methyltransferase